MSNNYESFNFNKLDSALNKDALDEVLEKDITSEPVSEKVVEEKEETVEKEVKLNSNSVYVYALRDLQKPGTVKLSKGVNEISKKDYERWKDSPAVRLANKQEIKNNIK